MRYVGNTSLSPQIQERILNTFQQTLSLAQEDNRQEALLGCDFILRLDPLFEPARHLQQRLNETEGAIEVADLAEIVDAEVEAAPQEATPGAVEAPVATEVPPTVEPAPVVTEVPPIVEQAPVATEVAPPEAPPAAASDIPGRMALLFEQRSYQELLQLAQEHQDLIAKNPELRQFAETATARFEAEPYVRNFIESARTAKDLGDLTSAQAHLEKARELDTSHPDLAILEGDLDAATPVAPPTEVPPLVVEPAPDETTAPMEVPPPTEVPPSVEIPPPLGASESQEPDEPVPPAPEVSAEEATAEEPVQVEPQVVPSLDAEPAARLDSESEQRINALLGEGQEAFDTGQYQSAIDAWSRIFLIDIDHAETSRRIELARKLKAEVERQIEESFHEAISMLESGKVDEAREAFQKTLELQPSHMGARDYLEKLDKGDLAPAEAKQPEVAPDVDAEAAADEAQITETHEASDLAFDQPAAPTSIPDDVYIGPEEEAVAKPAPRKRSFTLIGTAVLVIVLVAAWFVYSKWDSFFPASTDDQQTAGQPQIDPVERARELHEAGNTAMAINVLRRLPPGNDQYAEAQSLIAMWEVGDQPDESLNAGPTEADLARREELLEQAVTAGKQGENLLALALVEEAAQIAELEGEDMEIQTAATDMLEALHRERELFEQGDWEYALPELWRMHEADPQNRDVVRLMADSYFNLGLRDLQRGDPRAAQEKFEEALELSPDDEELQRMVEFATSYVQRPSDMLYRIFVKYQPFR